jgi:hypothetical protein
MVENEEELAGYLLVEDAATMGDYLDIQTWPSGALR